MMKHSLLLLPLLGMSAFGGDLVANAEKPHDWTNTVQDALTLYKSDTGLVRKVKLSWMEQYQMAVVQPNGSNGLFIRKPGSPFNHEFRRSWVGGNVDLATGTTFHVWGRIGGLPYRESYTGNHTRKNYSYTDLFDIWVKQDIKPVKGLSVKAGKIKPLFTTDYSTPSSQIMCTERSFIGNQHSLDSNWGIEINYAPTKKDNVYFQLMANDRAINAKSNSHGDVYRDGRGLKGEFGWEDKCFGIIGANHKFAETERGYQKLSAQYMHDFDNSYSSLYQARGNNYYGAQVKDALSLGHEIKRDALTLQSNLVMNFEMANAGTKYNGNNIGLQLQPVISLCPHADLVFRYVGMTGHNACKLSADRYITRQTKVNGMADSLHSFYGGVNLYASSINKNALKMMMGVEYVTARKNGSDCYNGWEYTTAFRWNF